MKLIQQDKDTITTVLYLCLVAFGGIVLGWPETFAFVGLGFTIAITLCVVCDICVFVAGTIGKLRKRR